MEKYCTCCGKISNFYYSIERNYSPPHCRKCTKLYTKLERYIKTEKYVLNLLIKSKGIKKYL